MMKRVQMRLAMAMIELIFAIVIIAISVLSIPSMMAVADNASKGMIIDEDILKRMMGEITKVSQARWDQNSTAPDFSPLQIVGDLPCTADPLRGAGVYRANPDSSMVCSPNSPIMAAAVADGNLSLNFGIEQLHNNPYVLEVNATGGNIYTIPIEYTVSYVTATHNAINGAGVATASWVLGSSGTPNPNPSANQTHLKRIVATCVDNDPNVNMTLTFFKSNVGKFSE